MKKAQYPYYEVERIDNLNEMAEKCADRYGDAAAFTFACGKKEIKTVSYRQFKSEVNQLGAVFYSMGLQNARIAIIGENSYEWILAYFAAVTRACVAVPIDRELTAEEIAGILSHCECGALVFSDTYSDIRDKIESSGLRIEHFINMKSISGLLEKGKELLSKGEAEAVNNRIDNDAAAVIVYTSGTTGVSKGVMLSQKNLCADTAASLASLHFEGKSLLVLPLHHTFTFTGNVLVMFYSGTTIAINKSLKNMSGDLIRHKPQNMLCVPLLLETLYKKIWENAQKSGKDRLLKKLIKISGVLLLCGIDVRRRLFKSVLAALGGNIDTIISGGAPLDVKYVKGFRDFGINVLNGYGISECAPVVAVNRNEYYRDGSVGLPLRSCEVRLSGENENGEGEILVRGDNVMLGYYKNEQATKEAFDGEWFKTGDIGRLDKDGFLYITGRIKNLIILSNGKNVYPEELEMKLLDIPLISEALIRGEDDQICAEIFLNKGYIKENNIEDPEAALQKEIDRLNKTLPLFKCIARVRLRDTEFPKTSSKKIKRSYQEAER